MDRPTDRDDDEGMMSDVELQSILSHEITNALGADGGKLSQDRRKLLQYYNGEPFGDEIEGRSQVMARPVLEVTEWVLPAILRVFASSDEIAEFEPYRPGEEPMARQATEYVNYIVRADNNAFMLLHNWFKDALIQKVGFIQVYWSDERTYSTSHYTGLSDQEFIALTQSDDVQVVEDHVYPNPDPRMTWFTQDDPEPNVPNLHDCQLRIWQTQGRVRIENVAPEEILVSRRAPSTLLDGKHFICRRVMKTVSELRELGIDEDLIEQAMGWNTDDWNAERVERFTQEDDFPLNGQRTDKPMVECALEESYIRVDYDGDGEAELRRILSAGNGSIILSNEPADDVPFIAITPVPMPHKFYGLSLADLVSDLQEIKTALWRQALDSAYLSTAPRMIVDENAMTESSYDDLLTVRPGGIIRVNNIQGVQPLTVPFVGADVLPMLTQLDQIQEIRTGVSRQNQTLSVDDLNKHASGAAIGMAQQAAAQRVELICRVFAETGVKELARKVLGLVIRHQQEARVIRLTGNWIPMDPRGWRESLDVNVNVGLGTASRDGVLAHLTSILQVQQQIVGVQKGVSGPLVTAENVYDVLKRMTENAGFKEAFFTDPRTAPPQGPPPPNPEMIKAQAEAQSLQADMQLQQQKVQAEIQLDERRFQHETQMEQFKAQKQVELEQMREQGSGQEIAAKIEALRAAALANLAKAGATHRGAQTDQALAVLSALDGVISRQAPDSQPAASPAPSAPVAAPSPMPGAPPVPGARQARDGNHYLPDPNRPGKFMMVV